jgi:hypothetical protein
MPPCKITSIGACLRMQTRECERRILQRRAKKSTGLWYCFQSEERACRQRFRRAASCCAVLRHRRTGRLPTLPQAYRNSRRGLHVNSMSKACYSCSETQVGAGESPHNHDRYFGIGRPPPAIPWYWSGRNGSSARQHRAAWRSHYSAKIDDLFLFEAGPMDFPP